MIFTETALKDVFLIDPEPVRDERGMFMREPGANGSLRRTGFRPGGCSQVFR